MANRLDGAKNVGFTLLPEQMEILRQWAAKEDRSMSAVIRRLIDEEALRVGPAETVSLPEMKRPTMRFTTEDSPPVEVEGKS